jgi:restriction endonuclease Mrr
MTEPERRIVAAVADIHDAYVRADEIDPTLPVGTYVTTVREALTDPPTVDDPPDVGTWYDDVAPVVDSVKTGELQDVFTDLQHHGDLLKDQPATGWGILALATLLIDCRDAVANTPVEPVTTRLSETVTAFDDENDRARLESLAEAAEAAASIARSTAVAAMAIERTDSIEFLHPDEDRAAVRSAIEDAHAARSEAELKRLALAVDRSYRGEWTQSDLVAYTDEVNSGKPFENLLADLWADMGYETDRTPDGNGDLGVDVVASSEDESVLIQAKRYGERKVNAKEVREVSGLFPQYEFDRAVVATSSGATQPAKDEAARVNDLDLIPGPELAEMLTDSALNPPVLVGQSD